MCTCAPSSLLPPFQTLFSLPFPHPSLSGNRKVNKHFKHKKKKKKRGKTARKRGGGSSSSKNEGSDDDDDEAEGDGDEEEQVGTEEISFSLILEKLPDLKLKTLLDAEKQFSEADLDKSGWLNAKGRIIIYFFFLTNKKI